MAAILLSCEQNNVEECPHVRKNDVDIERPDDIVCLGSASHLLKTPGSDERGRTHQPWIEWDRYSRSFCCRLLFLAFLHFSS
jgi:hypothetical protein